MLVQVQGMNLERYAQLMQLLEPFGARLKSVEGDRIQYEVSGSAEQIRSQLALAQLQETPAPEAAPAPQAPVDASAAAQAPAPMSVPAPAAQLYFRW